MIKQRKRAMAAAAVVVLVALAIPLWPKGAGGSTTYLVTRGASMQPVFDSGDFAVLRDTDDYRVGDIAAYRSLVLRRVVLHRILAINGSTFTFKGDANSFVDPEQVRREDVVGKLSVRVPKLGSVVLWLTSPFNAVLLATLITVAIADRKRLRAAFSKQQPKHAKTEPEPEPARLHDDRVVSISDLRFPYELAIADVVDEAALRRLADHYDRPVLYDEADGLLFVVESNMLFRCHLAGAPAPSLSVVPIRAPEPPPEEPQPQWSEHDQAWIFWQPEWSATEQRWTYQLLIWSDADQVWHEAPMTPEGPEQQVAAAPTVTTPKLPSGRMTPRRRVPSPQGRDWGYDDGGDDEPRSRLRWVR